MKITVRDKTRETLDWKKLPNGTIVEHKGGTISVVYQSVSDGVNEKSLLWLRHTNGNPVFDQAYGLLCIPIVKVLGTISEIVVE